MQFSNITTRNIAYGILGLFGIILIIVGFNIRNNIINSVFDIKNRNNNRNNSGNNRNNNIIREGFFNSNDNSDNNSDDNNNSSGNNSDYINECIKRKIKALKSELGINGNNNTNIKEMLNNAKLACDYDAVKCMINLLKKNTGPTSLNVDELFNNDDRDCVTYKNCTALSKDLITMINNLK